MDNKAIVYKSEKGEVKLSLNIIKKYLVKGGGFITDQEAMMFLMLCKNQKLNPFINDAYLIKYGTSPASMVVSKDVFIRRSRRHKDFRGYECGVIIKYRAKLFKLIPLWWFKKEYRKGTDYEKSEKLIGGWIRVYLQSWGDRPLEHTVNFDEYVQRKKDGTITKMWREKAGTMIRKVALEQGLREAFPEDLQACYASEELGIEDDETLDNITKTENGMNKLDNEIADKAFDNMNNKLDDAIEGEVCNVY